MRPVQPRCHDAGEPRYPSAATQSLTRRPQDERIGTLIADEIAREGPITFARFMALALYHPHLGYYAGGGVGREPLGWEGDYVTSGDVTPLWGWGIAHQLHQMWELLERPTCFDVFEPGAGRGLLAVEVWRYALERAPDWASALRYTLADRAPTGSPLRAERERRLAAALAALGVPTSRTRWVDEPSAVCAPRSLVGCIVSNELVDALPVHIVAKRADALAEVFVGHDDTTARLVELLAPPSSLAVGGYLRRYGVDWREFPEGWRAEINLVAEDWMRRTGELLGRGFVLTLDYGDHARRLYVSGSAAWHAQRLPSSPGWRRSAGDPGEQDLTAHVNFSALITAGRGCGLRLAGLTTQAALFKP